MQTYSLWRRARRAVPVMLAAALVAGCGSDDTPSDATASSDAPIVIGGALAKSGFMSTDDGPITRAMELAVDEINAEGGVGGRKLELRVEDTKTDQEQAATAAQRLLDDGADVIVTSADFDYGSPSAFVAQQAGKLAISAGAGSPKFGRQGIGELAFTMGTVTPTVASTAAEWAFSERDWKRAYLLCDASIEYSKSLCDYFRAAFTAQGGTISGEDSFQQKDTSIASQVTKLRAKAADTDVVYLASYNPGAASALRQIRAAGVTTPIIGGEAMDGRDWLKSVPGLKDFYVTAYGFVFGPSEQPGVEAFVKRYAAANGGKRPPTSQALLGYSTVQAIAAAVEAAGGKTDGASLAAAMAGFENEDLLVGPTTMTSEHHFALDRPMAIVEVDAGSSRFVQTFRAKNVVEPEF